MKFFRCEHCKKIITEVNANAVPVICCGEKMKELIPGTTDAAQEKHVPVVSVNENTVTVAVGEVAHPMLDAHYIEWIALETAQGVQIKHLNPGDAPQATFALSEGDSIVEAYAYCNLHSLWKS